MEHDQLSLGDTLDVSRKFSGAKAFENLLGFAILKLLNHDIIITFKDTNVKRLLPDT